MSIPRYLPILTCLTAIYLIFELAFNARLLDAAGGLATSDEIHSIEIYGRIISGFAFALAVCGMYLMPLGEELGWSFSEHAKVIVIAVAICVTTVFYAEKTLVDTLADSSSGESRSIAAHLGILAHAALTHDVRIDDVDLSSAELARPEGKAFIALFPVLAYSTTNLDEKDAAAVQEIVRQRVRQTLGSPEEFYNRVFIPSASVIASLYNEYVIASNNLWQTISSAPEDRLEATSRYDNWVQQAFGSGANLPPGLAFPAFIEETAVQTRWHNQLGIPNGNALSWNESVAAFKAAAYDTEFNQTVNDQMQVYGADTVALANGGSLQEQGREAMRALLVPPIALAFSLIGGIVHVTKLSLCIAGFLPGSKGAKKALVFSIVMAGATIPFFSPNEITKSPLFTYFQRESTQTLGTPAELAMTWVVQAEPFGFPVNEWVRENCAFGVTYGYDTQPDQSVVAANNQPQSEE